MTQQQSLPQLQPKLLALDPGEARIGVAISDDLGMFAHPRDAIRTRDVGAAVRAVSALVTSEAIAEVIVGLPLTLAGERGHQAEAVRPLVEALRKQLSVPVREVDERFSSQQAQAADRRLAGRRDGSLDSASAAVVLQSVLDARRGAIDPGDSRRGRTSL
jgi:putative Holliday junction resolvase